jgi:uncharacterized membrane protein
VAREQREEVAAVGKLLRGAITRTMVVTVMVALVCIHTWRSTAPRASKHQELLLLLLLDTRSKQTTTSSN